MILMNGCSHVYGDDLYDIDNNNRYIAGTQVPYRVSSIIQQQLNKTVNNISRNGFSVHGVFRTTLLELLCNPYETCIVVWPDPARMEIPHASDFTQDKLSQRAIDGWRTYHVSRASDRSLMDVVCKEVKEFDIFNNKIIWYSTIIQQLCKKLKINLIEWSIQEIDTQDRVELKEIKNLFDTNSWVDVELGWISYGEKLGLKKTSGDHFNRESQKFFAEKILTKYYF